MIYSPSWHSKHVWLSFFRTKNSMGPVLFGPQRSAFCIFCFCVLQKEGWKSYNSRGLVIDVGILSNYFLSISLSFSKEATVFLGLTVDENAKEANFSYTVSLFEKKCLPEPELWLYQSLAPLSVILALLVVLILLSSQLVQLRVVLSEQFFSDVAEKRAAYLHAKILRKRCKTKAGEHEGALKTLAIQVGHMFSTKYIQTSLTQNTLSWECKM